MNQKPFDHHDKVVEIYDTEEDALRAQRAESSSSSSKYVAVGIFAFVAFLLISTAVVGWIGWSQYVTYKAQYDKDFVAPLALNVDRWKNVRATMLDPQVTVDEKTSKAIKKLITNIYAESKKEDRRGIYQYIDKDGFIEQMLRSEQCTLSRHLKREIKMEFDEITLGPDWYGNFEIVAINELGPSPSDELLVYLHAWDTGYRSHTDTLRFWVKRTKGRWKVSDWESIDQGLSAASQYAALSGAVYNGRLQRNYYKFCDTCYEVESAALDGDYSDASIKLESAPLDVPFSLRPSAHLRLGNAYSLANKPAKAIDSYLLEKEPKLAIGILYQLAECHSELDRPDVALKYIDRYLNVVGFTPAAVGMKSELLSELGRDQEAFDQLAKLAEIFPQDHSLARRLQDSLTTDNAEQISELAATLPDSESFLRTALQRRYGIKNRPLAKKLLEIAKSRGNNVVAIEAEASIASTIHDYPTASACYLRAIEAADNREDKLRLQNEYLSLMDTMDQAGVALGRVPFPIEAMEEFAELHSYGDMITSNEAMEKIASEFHADHPDLASANFIYGSVLSTNKKWTESLPIWKKVVEGDESDFSDRGESYLREVLIELGEFEQAFEVGGASKDNWTMLAGNLSTKDIQGHRKLLNLYEEKVELNDKLRVKYGLVRSRAIIDWEAGYRERVISTLFEHAIFNTDDYYGPARNLLRELLVKVGVDEISNVMDDWQTHARFGQMTKQQREKLTSILSESLDQSTSDGKLLRTRTLLKFQSLASGKPISENYWIGKLALDNDNDKLLSDTIKKLDSDDLTADSLDGYRGGAFFRRAALRLIENGKHQAAKSFIKRVESGGEFKADEIVKLALALSTGDLNTGNEILENWHDSDYGINSHTLLNTPATSSFFSDDRFKNFRANHALSVAGINAEEIHFMFNKKPDAQPIIDKIEELLPALRFAQVNNAEGPELQEIAWLKNDFVSVCIRKGTLKRFEGSDKKTEIPKHQWVLSIGSRNYSNNEQITKLNSPAISQLLADSPCVAAYIGKENLLIHNFDAWAKTKAASKQRFSRSDRADYLHFEAAETAEKKPWWKIQNEVSLAFIEILEGRSRAQDYEVQVPYTNGSLEETHWFPLKTVSMDDSELEIVLQRSRTIQILQLFEKDEPQQVSLYQIHSIRKKQSN